MRPGEDAVKLTVIMAVGRLDLPAEGRPFLGQRLQAVGVFRARALLQAIAIDDSQEIVEAHALIEDTTKVITQVLSPDTAP